MSDGVCPCCHGTGFATAPPDPNEQARTWLIERGFWIGLGDEIRTDAAAAVFGVSAQWLRQLRCYFAEHSPPWRRAGRHCVYRLRDLREWRGALDGLTAVCRGGTRPPPLFSTHWLDVKAQRTQTF